MFRLSVHVLSVFQYKDKGKDCLLVLYRAYHKSMNMWELIQYHLILKTHNYFCVQVDTFICIAECV